jgi:DUF1009 family protein
MEKIAIISGRGELPQLLAKTIKLLEKEAIIIHIDQKDSISWEENFTYYIVNLGSVGGIISLLQDNNIKKVMFAGSITSPQFKDIKLDAVGVGLMAEIAKRRIKGDDNILTAICDFLEKKGFQVIGPQMILEKLQVKEGLLGKISVDIRSKEDVKLGIDVLKELSKFDIGQAIVVNDGHIVAIEAAEGTDKMLERVASLHNKGGVLIKLKKLNQNINIDMPTIGLETAKNAYRAGLEGIVIEANSVFVLNKLEVIQFTDDNGLFFKAI